MFLEHFSLREQPFGVTPDPAYLYLGETHRSALDSLSTGVRNDRGFMAVIAEPGMGKTTLLYHLLDQLRDNARTIFIFQTQCDSREFFGHLLLEFGIDPAGMDIVAMHERLNKTLFSEMLAGRRVVLVVDEAQNLAEPVLETVRLLSNFETSHAKLLQIIFAGQPQLASKLASPALAQLRQRIAIVARLNPFRADETSAYIQHRLGVAGYWGDRIFTVDALGAIAQASNGVPRIINNLCFNAMCLAFDRRLKLLDVDVVSEAVGQLRLDPVVAEASVPLPIVSRRSSAGPKSKLSPAAARVFTAYPSARLGPVNKSWVYGSAALAVLIPVGVWGISRSLGRRVKAAPETAETQIQRPVQQAVEPTLDAVSGTTPQAITSLQFLLVSVQPNDTVKEISLRYLGRFDDEILHQISALNPELKDLNEMASGQLLRVPFPSGMMKKVYDSDSAPPSLDVGSAWQTADVIQPSPRDRTASAGVNVASVQPIKHVPLHAAVPEPSSNISNQDATEQAEAPNADVPNAVSTLHPAANAASPAQATVAALGPSIGESPDPSLPADAPVPPASSVQAAKIEPAELISRRDPVYPMIAKNSRISGSVEMHFKVSTEGRVFDAAVIKGPPLLAQAALQAVQEWRYKPARRNGVPIESEATTVFDFKGN
jgi:TonB family protein